MKSSISILDGVMISILNDKCPNEIWGNLSFMIKVLYQFEIMLCSPFQPCLLQNLENLHYLPNQIWFHLEMFHCHGQAKLMVPKTKQNMMRLRTDTSIYTGQESCTYLITVTITKQTFNWGVEKIIPTCLSLIPPNTHSKWFRIVPCKIVTQESKLQNKSLYTLKLLLKWDHHITRWCDTLHQDNLHLHQGKVIRHY